MLARLLEAEFAEAEHEVFDAELGAEELQVAVDGFGAVVAACETELRAAVLFWKFKLFKDFEPKAKVTG